MMGVVTQTFILILIFNNSIINCKYLYKECREWTETSFVNNGDEVEPDRYPWQALVFDIETGESCEGSIITEKHVLTMAQCLYNMSMNENLLYVEIGSPPDYDDGAMDAIGKIRDITYYSEHDEVGDFNKTSAIAILTMNQSFRKSKKMMDVVLY